MNRYVHETVDKFLLTAIKKVLSPSSEKNISKNACNIKSDFLKLVSGSLQAVI